MMTGLVDRERRIRNLNDAVGKGLEEEIRGNKSSLGRNLSLDFNREMTLAEACVYNSDFEGALYHGFLARMIHRALKELEG